ncbi:hypothetical protein E2K80_18820 [Rhodophyticola sp. CCM32]|uniref:hypothetical protein n=1 Tax=Rhodophyticola sp. CCM32 TaxID=2916397 RepID=UPI00107EEE39|nr:hypothetical protein [Rhodophyticola sp. CCM32]QBY02537.1 hypothetical protein E2K80_18820 [Rhodophyticola sp. CCM32]
MAMIICPFCKTEIAADATVCHGCGARKGYGPDNHGGVHSGGSIGFLAVVCAILIFVGLSLGGSWLFFTLLGGLGLPFCLFPLLSGPKWYR